ncbi:MAG: 2-hydroxyacyl-CoA dehydratase, partial [Proteobacteria bacterium]|nr:2-hydroxyacyl-CoA dehydratase [Pseudomonadota bacterium]
SSTGNLCFESASVALRPRKEVTDGLLRQAVSQYSTLAQQLAELARVHGHSQEMQELYNYSVTHAATETLDEIERFKATTKSPAPGVPVLLFGNVLPDPEAFQLFEDCGLFVVADELCTGAKQLVPVEIGDEEIHLSIARALLGRAPCARTFDSSDPGGLGKQLVARVKAAGARGVVTHVMKFCDPYLARLPAVRAELRQAGISMLVLEGDCTLGALGQYETRIEAFAEMLGEI